MEPLATFGGDLALQIMVNRATELRAEIRRGLQDLVAQSRHLEALPQDLLRATRDACLAIADTTKIGVDSIPELGRIAGNVRGIQAQATRHLLERRVVLDLAGEDDLDL